MSIDLYMVIYQLFMSGWPTHTSSVLGALPQDGDTFEAHETSGFTW